MKSLLAALAIVAGACMAFGPDAAEARLNAKRDCTTPKFETPIAPPAVQYAPVPLQQVVTPPTVVETPPTTVTIPGQTITLPPTTVTVPGTQVTVPGTVQAFQAPVVPYAQPYAVPICPDDAPRTPLKTFLQQRRLKREKHLGIEEPTAVPEKETSAACKRCKKRLRGWDEATQLVV